mmetsp:Transcript_9864/g.41428  ORF Transcript_9864/g.41428 Transcript_9864/m.41428 type:complete len:229 (+) Transcript_9864:966-1652(+)
MLPAVSQHRAQRGVAVHAIPLLLVRLFQIRSLRRRRPRGSLRPVPEAHVLRATRARGRRNLRRGDHRVAVRREHQQLRPARAERVQVQNVMARVLRRSLFVFFFQIALRRIGARHGRPHNLLDGRVTRVRIDRRIGVSPALEPAEPALFVSAPRLGGAHGAVAPRQRLFARGQTPRREQRRHLQDEPQRHVPEPVIQQPPDERRLGRARVARAEAHGVAFPERLRVFL